MGHGTRDTEGKLVCVAARSAGDAFVYHVSTCGLVRRVESASVLNGVGEVGASPPRLQPSLSSLLNSSPPLVGPHSCESS